jgi:hypothetical protein
MSEPSAGTPYKVVLLLKAAPSITAVAFSKAWLAAPLPAWPRGLAGYFHNIADVADVPIENAPPAAFDAADEFLFDDFDDAAAFFGSDAFARDWLDPRRHLLGQPILAISGGARTVWDGGHVPAADTVKVVTLPMRRPGMAIAAFVHHWLDTHAGLALSGPGTQDRLVRLVSTPADRRLFAHVQLAPFDGVGIVQFVSLDAFKAEFSSDHYRTVLAPDEPRFTDPLHSRAMTVRETAVFRRR